MYVAAQQPLKHICLCINYSRCYKSVTFPCYKYIYVHLQSGLKIHLVISWAKAFHFISPPSSYSKESYVRLLSQRVHDREVYFQPGRLGGTCDSLNMSGVLEEIAKAKTSLRQQPIGGPKVMFIQCSICMFFVCFKFLHTCVIECTVWCAIFSSHF